MCNPVSLENAAVGRPAATYDTVVGWLAAERSRLGREIRTDGRPRAMRPSLVARVWRMVFVRRSAAQEHFGRQVGLVTVQAGPANRSNSHRSIAAGPAYVGACQAAGSRQFSVEGNVPRMARISANDECHFQFWHGLPTMTCGDEPERHDSFHPVHHVNPVALGCSVRETTAQRYTRRVAGGREK